MSTPGTTGLRNIEPVTSRHCSQVQMDPHGHPEDTRVGQQRPIPVTPVVAPTRIFPTSHCTHPPLPLTSSDTPTSHSGRHSRRHSHTRVSASGTTTSDTDPRRRPGHDRRRPPTPRPVTRGRVTGLSRDKTPGDLSPPSTRKRDGLGELGFNLKRSGPGTGRTAGEGRRGVQGRFREHRWGWRTESWKGRTGRRTFRGT